MTDIIRQTSATLVATDLDRFDQAVSRFLATRNSNATKRTYRRAIDLYRAHAVAHDLDPLGGDALISFSEEQNAERRDRGGQLANGTIRLRLKTVQSLLTWCYAFGLMPLKPEMVTTLITMPPTRKLSPRDVLTNDEARQLLGAADPGRDRCLIRLLLDNGLRVSEALALTSDDVYPALDRFWTLVRAGKGDKSREVETPPDLWAELDAYQNGAQLFDLHRSTAWRIVDRVASAAGIDKTVTPHSLRHTHAHQLRLAGWPLEAIADRLGHASLETTKFYTRPAELSRQIALPVMPWAKEQ